MNDWNKENDREQIGICINKLTDEVDRILFKKVDEEMGKLGVAYGIIRDYSDNPEEPPIWIIQIEDTKTALTSDNLFEYLSKHKNLEDALTRFMRDHFQSYFT
ncbi:hypothetical protein ACE3NQ_16155 [Paenibacillus terreus]|uniref:Uncharacterized protein n=1 Tax=Paenibacillus terreus TaxID=1387834 RepID=A0ABV5B9T5_9BACL